MWLIHHRHGTEITDRPRSFLEAGFRPLCPPFDYFVPLSRTNPAFWISTRTAPGPISLVLPGCRVRHPQYSKKLFVLHCTHTRLIHESVTSQTWLIRLCLCLVTRVSMSRIWMRRHVAFTCCVYVSLSVTWQTWLIRLCLCLITRIWMRRHVAFTCVTWRSYICDTTHSHMWHDAVTYVTRRIHICDMTHAFTYVTRRIRINDDITPWLIHLCDVTHSSQTWHTHEWDRHECAMSVMKWSHHTDEWVMGPIHLCDVTHSSQTWHRNHRPCTHTRLIHLCAMSHYMYINEATRRIHICDMTQLHMWHHAFT